MTNIYDGQITDLLNNSLRYNPEVAALSCAVQKEKQRIIRLAAKTHLLSDVDSLSERALDYLAVELRTPAYSESYPLEMKRKLIAETIPFYSHLGTPAAVDLVINAIFTGGHVEEWFQYGGEPHHFRVFIDLTGRITTFTETNEIYLLINSIKRLSSWLDETRYFMEAKPALFRLGGSLTTIVNFPIPQEPDKLNCKSAVKTGGTQVGITALLPVPEQKDYFKSRLDARVGGKYSVIAASPAAGFKEE